MESSNLQKRLTRSEAINKELAQKKQNLEKELDRTNKKQSFDGRKEYEIEIFEIRSRFAMKEQD